MVRGKVKCANCNFYIRADNFVDCSVCKKRFHYRMECTRVSSMPPSTLPERQIRAWKNKFECKTCRPKKSTTLDVSKSSNSATAITTKVITKPAEPGAVASTSARATTAVCVRSMPVGVISTASVPVVSSSARVNSTPPVASPTTSVPVAPCSARVTSSTSDESPRKLMTKHSKIKPVTSPSSYPKRSDPHKIAKVIEEPAKSVPVASSSARVTSSVSDDFTSRLISKLSKIKSVTRPCPYAKISVPLEIAKVIEKPTKSSPVAPSPSYDQTSVPPDIVEFMEESTKSDPIALSYPYAEPSVPLVITEITDEPTRSDAVTPTSPYTETLASLEIIDLPEEHTKIDGVASSYPYTETSDPPEIVKAIEEPTKSSPLPYVETSTNLEIAEVIEEPAISSPIAPSSPYAETSAPLEIVEVIEEPTKIGPVTPSSPDAETSAPFEFAEVIEKPEKSDPSERTSLYDKSPTFDENAPSIETPMKTDPIPSTSDAHFTNRAVRETAKIIEQPTRSDPVALPSTKVTTSLSCKISEIIQKLSQADLVPPSSLRATFSARDENAEKATYSASVSALPVASASSVTEPSLMEIKNLILETKDKIMALETSVLSQMHDRSDLNKNILDNTVKIMEKMEQNSEKLNEIDEKIEMVQVPEPQRSRRESKRNRCIRKFLMEHIATKGPLKKKHLDLYEHVTLEKRIVISGYPNMNEKPYDALRKIVTALGIRNFRNSETRFCYRKTRTDCFVVEFVRMERKCEFMRTAKQNPLTAGLFGENDPAKKDKRVYLSEDLTYYDFQLYKEAQKRLFPYDYVVWKFQARVYVRRKSTTDQSNRRRVIRCNDDIDYLVNKERVAGAVAAAAVAAADRISADEADITRDAAATTDARHEETITVGGEAADSALEDIITIERLAGDDIVQQSLPEQTVHVEERIPLSRRSSDEPSSNETSDRKENIRLSGTSSSDEPSSKETSDSKEKIPLSRTSLDEPSSKETSDSKEKIRLSGTSSSDEPSSKEAGVSKELIPLSATFSDECASKMTSDGEEQILLSRRSSDEHISKKTDVKEGIWPTRKSSDEHASKEAEDKERIPLSRESSEDHFSILYRLLSSRQHGSEDTSSGISDLEFDEKSSSSKYTDSSTKEDQGEEAKDGETKE